MSQATAFATSSTGRPLRCHRHALSGIRAHVALGQMRSQAYLPPEPASMNGALSAGMPRVRHSDTDGGLTLHMPATAEVPPRSSMICANMPQH